MKWLENHRGWIAVVAPSHLNRLAWFLVLLLVALLSANLFWRYQAPEPTIAMHRHIADPRAAAALVTRHGTDSAVGPRSADAPASKPAFRLVGLATGFANGPGFVILETPDGQREIVLAGATASDGSTLRTIFADGAALETNGVTANLRLAASPTAAAPALPQTP